MSLNVFNLSRYSSSAPLWDSEDHTSSTFALHVVRVEVVGQLAVLSPDVQLSEHARLDHLLLPGDRDVARSEVSVELGVLVVQDDAFDRAEGAHVVNIFGVDRPRIGDKRWR